MTDEPRDPEEQTAEDLLRELALALDADRRTIPRHQMSVETRASLARALRFLNAT